MTTCCICGAPTSDDTDICAWCDTANFSASGGRAIPQPWWVALRRPLAPQRDGLRALLPAPPAQEDTP